MTIPKPGPLATIALIAGLGLPPACAEPLSWQNPDDLFCRAMYKMAESATRQKQVVKLDVWKAGKSMRHACRASRAPAARAMCAPLLDHRFRFVVPLLARNALHCIGVGDPEIEPTENEISLHAHYLGGEFQSEPINHSSGKVKLEVSLDASDATASKWLTIRAVPITNDATPR